MVRRPEDYSGLCAQRGNRAASAIAEALRPRGIERRLTRSGSRTILCFSQQFPAINGPRRIGIPDARVRRDRPVSSRVISERGTLWARCDNREYREYLSEEQRRPAGGLSRKPL